MPDDVETPDYGDDTLVERIEKRNLVPLFDANHTHVYNRDAGDETEDYYAEQCVKCPVGRLIRKA